MPKTSASAASSPAAVGGLPEDTGLTEGLDPAALAGLVELQEVQQVALEERIAELEFELEDIGWLRENQRAGFEFSPQNLLRIINWSRVMYLKNPLVGRGVDVQADYVFAQGVNISLKADQAKLDDFLMHPKNMVELTTADALWAKEVRLKTEGNIFFALFCQKGQTTVVRTIPVEDILNEGDVICNPEDRREPWYYKRVWTSTTFDTTTGKTGSKTKRIDYYPDWLYNPKTKPATIGKDDTAGKVHWDVPVMHVKVGGLDEMVYGVPEVYSALPWARATVRDLEDYASVKRALARFAWKAEMKGGKPAITALRNKLGTTSTVAAPVENNPPPVSGSMWAATAGYNMEPIRTAGAQPDSSSGRQIRVMAATGMGLPDTILSGDASVGALATAKTLDRPTELKMRKRQGMWERVLTNIIVYSLGRQAGRSLPTADGTASFSEAYLDQAQVKALNIDWPPILERDAAGRVSAVISAATLDGKTKAGTMTDRNLIMLLLQALGLDDNIDDFMEKLKFDEDDMLEKTEEQLAMAKLAAGSPGGPTPGPDPEAPPDRQAQGLERYEPAATPSEIMAQRNQESGTTFEEVLGQLRLVREALEA